MLGETNNGDWLFRRNPAVARSLRTLGTTTNDGVPYIAPEILLLFKAKHPRPKDEQDFNGVIAKLESPSRDWLRTAISATHPDHPWLRRL
jgi:hypothetical protein